MRPGNLTRKTTEELSRSLIIAAKRTPFCVFMESAPKQIKLLSTNYENTHKCFIDLYSQFKDGGLLIAHEWPQRFELPISSIKPTTSTNARNSEAQRQVNTNNDYEFTRVELTNPTTEGWKLQKAYRLRQNLAVLVNPLIKAPLVDGSQVALLNHLRL